MTSTPHNRINTRYNEIWLDEEGVVCIRPFEMYEMDLDEVTACFGAYRELGVGVGRQKFLHLVDARNSFTVTREARDYIAQQVEQYFIASAVISKSITLRLLVNFFNRFYRVGMPLKLFSTETEARKWLKKIGDQSGSVKKTI